MLRVLSNQTGIVLNVLSFTRHTARINAFFDQLQPGLKMRLLHFEPGSISVALEIKAAIERGEFVGILADRVWEAERGRSVEVSFLGRRTRFPLGPFLLQATLGCPMLLSTCVRTGHGRYLAATERFAPAVVIPRSERVKYAEELAMRYAATLERAVPAHALSVVQLLRVLAIRLLTPAEPRGAGLRSRWRGRGRRVRAVGADPGPARGDLPHAVCRRHRATGLEPRVPDGDARARAIAPG